LQTEKALERASQYPER